MPGLTLQSPLRERSRPEMPAPAAPPSERPSTSGLGAGAVFCLCGLGLCAAIMVIAFFGAGLLLLMQHPSRIGHAAIAPAPVAKHRPTISPPAPPKPVAPPSVAAAAASSPLQQAGKAPPPPALPKKAPAKPAAPIPSMTPPAATTAADPRLRARDATAAAVAPLATASSRQPDAAVKARPANGPTAPLEGRSNQPLSAAPPDQSARLALSKAEILLLLNQGDAAFRRGDLAVARLFYQRAIEAGEGRGALGMGATYDPLFLRRYDIWTQRADSVEASAWYRRALKLGATEAAPRLDRLEAPAPRQAPVGPR